MICPKCGVAELRIGESYTDVENGKAVIVQPMYCSNPQCWYGNNHIPVRVNKTIKDDAPSLKDLIVCCSSVLAKVGDAGYQIPEGIQYTERDGNLNLTCPECGKTTTVNVQGKKLI